jgi:hypothetical protein
LRFAPVLLYQYRPAMTPGFHAQAHVETVARPHAGWWLAVVGGMAALGILAFHGSTYAFWQAQVTTLLSQTLLRRIFVAAVLTHLAEALYALRLAQRIGDGATALGWFVQTLTLGYPSLRLLRARARRLS